MEICDGNFQIYEKVRNFGCCTEVKVNGNDSSLLPDIGKAISLLLNDEYKPVIFSQILLINKLNP